MTSLVRLVTAALAALLFAAPRAFGADGDPVGVVIETDAGAITLDVYPDRAPISAADFLRYVDDDLYTDGGFYRVFRPDNDNGSPVITVIQGGLMDPGKARGAVAHETTADTGLRHVDGAVSLARGAPGTGSAATFFISVGDNPPLDFGGARNPDGQGFAVFGNVRGGMDVVRAINARTADGETDEPYVAGQLLTEPVRIRSARRLAP